MQLSFNTRLQVSTRTRFRIYPYLCDSLENFIFFFLLVSSQTILF